MSQDLRSLIAAQERAASVAGQRGEKARLLEDADQNIGNQLLVRSIPAPLPITIPTQNPDRLLNLNCASKSGQMMTVFAGASATPIPAGQTVFNPPSNFVTGIIEFGNGSRFSSVEFDIPIGPIQYAGPHNSAPIAPQQGGILLSIPAGTLRMYARSDANLVTPNNIGGLPFGFGPDHDAPNRLIPPAFGGIAADVLVSAFAGYFTRTSIFAPTKTLWLGGVNVAGGVEFISNAYAIPALARTIRILRNNVAGIGISIDLADASLAVLDQISIPAGTRSDTYKLPGNAAFFFFTAATTTTPMPSGSIIQAIFELDL